MYDKHGRSPFRLSRGSIVSNIVLGQCLYIPTLQLLYYSNLICDIVRQTIPLWSHYEQHLDLCHTYFSYTSRWFYTDSNYLYEVLTQWKFQISLILETTARNSHQLQPLCTSVKRSLAPHVYPGAISGSRAHTHGEYLQPVIPPTGYRTYFPLAWRYVHMSFHILLSKRSLCCYPRHRTRV